MTTRELTIDKLTEGDTVTAINGNARPFPYTVTRVINTTVKGRMWTQVRYAHGGLIPPCDPTTAVATVVDAD
jgi:hypothetical protein